MLKSLQKAFKVKEVRDRLLYTFMMLVVIRIGCCLPIPGVDPSYLHDFFSNLQNSGMGFFNCDHRRIFLLHVYLRIEYHPVYHIFHHYAVTHNCNSEA